MHPGSLLGPSAILPQLTVNSTRQLLHALAAAAAPEAGVDKWAIFQALLEREQRESTGFGNGVALPHARLPGLARCTGVFARLEPPLDFDAPDSRPVELVFCLLSPAGNDAQHLEALAGISRRLGRPEVRRVLRGAGDPDAIRALLAGEESDQPEAA